MVVSTLLAIGLVCLVAILLFSVFGRPNQKTSSTAQSPTTPVSAPAFQITTPQPKESVIVKDSFALPPSYLKSYPLFVGKSGLVSGRFEARGGIDNAIQVVITDDDGYTNMSSGNTFRAWYNSAEVTVDNIKASLPPGRYRLVYSNQRSLTNRIVTTEVQLTDCCY